MESGHKASKAVKSIVGGTLVGIGLHSLSGNLNWVAAQMGHLLGSGVREALATLPSVILAASQAARAYGLDRYGFLLGLLRMLLAFWPLLLVAAGGILLREVLTYNIGALPRPNQMLEKNTLKNTEIGCRFRCPSFDV
jgi:hypothetical protein